MMARPASEFADPNPNPRTNHTLKDNSVMKTKNLTWLLAGLLVPWPGVARAGTVNDSDPAPGGIGYAHTVTLDANDSASLSNHVGAWSWEDDSLFTPPEPTVGWTHTSRWVALDLLAPTVLTVTMSRDADVPWPSVDQPDRKASVASMFPSLTIWRGWDNDDGDNHTYNNRGDVSWAEDLSYLDHVDNSTEESVTRSWVLPAGVYTLALGSNAPATDSDRQGFAISLSTGTVSETDPAVGGIGYRRTVIVDRVDAGQFAEHVGAWSWEDDSLFAPGDPTVGWTHTSSWVALRVLRDTTFTVTMERDATVPWPSPAEPGRLADISSMFPSLTVYEGWDNDDGDNHTYNNRGNIDWAEDLRYLDHVDNSTEESITRTWFLPAGDYSLALGSNAPANNALRQGFRFFYSTQPAIAADPMATPGGVGYARTVTVAPGETGSFSSHVGAWSWEDNALFSPGEPSVGWTHTSNWMALNVEEESYVTLTMERDPDVPWPSPATPDRKADTASMFPSLTVYRGWDNDDGDHHTYNNRGNVAWAEDLRYLDHVDNSTEESITRTWRLPAGRYSLALGSNAPATNPNRQGYRLTYAASAFEPVKQEDPAAGGIGYSWTISVSPGETGNLSDHVGAWSWEDNALFSPGDPPVGWTHTSRWVALQVTAPLTLDIEMSRDADVPWPSGAAPDRKASTASMYPSLTLWRGWDNDGSDSHTYNNRGNVAWAEDLDYLDHCDNSTAETVTRSWTLEPGHYTLALGSNAPANDTDRQGFSFSWSTSPARWLAPRLTRQPRDRVVVEGGTARFQVGATGPDASIQWMRDGSPIPGANRPLLIVSPAMPGDAGEYVAEIRNSAGWLRSDPATLTVISVPEIVDPGVPAEFTVGQQGGYTLDPLEHGRYVMTGLPRGLRYDPRTGVITGTPAISGNFQVRVVAINAAGRGAPWTFQLSVDPMPDNSVGSFAGMIERAPLLNDQLGGGILIRTTPGGAFSALLKLGRSTHRSRGTLDIPQGGDSPTGGFTINRRGLPQVAVEFTIQSDSGVISGTVTDGSVALPFTARQKITDPTGYDGGYTFALLPDPALAGNETVPGGYSIGGMRISPSGLARGTIRLADGSPVAFSGPLNVDGYIDVCRLLYRGGGSLLGAFQVQGDGDLRLSAFDWLKNAVPAASRDRVYRDGFGPLLLEVVGRVHDTTLSSIKSLGLTADPAGNARLSFSDGGLVDAETRLDVIVEVLSGERKAVNVVSANPGNVSLVIRRALPFRMPRAGIAGTSFGKFTLMDANPANPAAELTRTVSFECLIVDDGSGPKLYGFFLLPRLPEAGPPATSLRNSPILSGKVLLEPLVP